MAAMAASALDARRRFLRGAALALALLVPGLAAAAESTAVTSPRVKATLLSSRDAARPGERFQVALVQQIARGWHTYWQNPGDSGEAKIGRAHV